MPGPTPQEKQQIDQKVASLARGANILADVKKDQLGKFFVTVDNQQ